MTNSKIDFNLKGVPHTLVFPLLGRVIAARDQEIDFSDPYAEKVLEALNYDFETAKNKMSSFEHSNAWAAERAIFFDNEICRFLKQHPKGTVINLGAGLETNFYRVDNGELTWVDLDMPEVINLRKKLLSPTSRVHSIDKSILDFSWINDVTRFSDHVFMFAAGLLMYLTENEVKSIFIELANRLPNSVLVFDSFKKQDLAMANDMFKKFGLMDVQFQWGMDEGEVKSWSPKIQIIFDTPYQNILKKQPKEPMFHGTFTKICFKG